MASVHKHIRSGTANKRPTTAISDGQIALNTNLSSPGLFFKDSTGAAILKIGPVHVGATAPNASPAGSAGNSIGEIWLDTSLTPIGVKIYDGSAFVNATPIGSTTVQGLLELATDAETQAGADTARAVTSASLQSKLSDSTSTTSNITIASSTAVKAAYDLANAALPKTGGTVTGNLEIGTAGSLSFEGATADGFETTIAVVDPTADRTITLPNTTGTIVTTGDTGTVTSTMLLNGTIVDADINASAEIAVSKLADGAARQLLQTDAAGTGVEWASNIDIPGTLDVTSAATFDSSVAVTGALTKSGSNVVTVGDTGTVTSTMLLNGTILNADVNNTAGIVASKLSFTQAGTGAVQRTVDSKLKEIEINVKDFGAVGDGVTYDSPAIGLALAQAQQTVSNGAGFGSQIGVTLKFPLGKYRISEPIPLLYGIKIVGEQSGLVNAGNALSTGTILLLSDTLPNSSPWTTSTLVGGNTISKRVMFTVVDGGPIQMENFGAIPEGNNSTNAVFLLAGNGFPVPHNSVGVTQALFRGIRAFEFGEVFRGSRFFDVTIENCGFEYNTTVFSPVVSGFLGFGDINSTNTQYFENYSLVDLASGASFNNTNFSSCVFTTEGNTNSNLVWGYGGDFSNVHFSSCEFFRGAANTGNAISVIGSTFICQGVTFASCRIKNLPLFNGTQIATPNDQLLNNSFAGNTFENCTVTIELEGRGGNSFVGNAFTGTSSFSHKGDGLVFAANNFNENSFSGNDFTLADTTNATVVGNVFRSAKQSINFATLSTCKITDNVNQISFANLSTTTVTAGSSGWSNSSPTPEFYYDETGHVRCRGVVTNSGSPGASSIMCQGLPLPTGNKWFVLPATDNSAGNAVVVIGSGGSQLYFLARNGTSNSYDLSPISYSTL